MISEKCFIVEEILEQFLLSLGNLTTLKYPPMHLRSLHNPLVSPSSAHNSSLSALLTGPYAPKNTQIKLSSQFLNRQEREWTIISISGSSKTLLSQKTKIPPNWPLQSTVSQFKNLPTPSFLTNISDKCWTLVSYRQTKYALWDLMRGALTIFYLFTSFKPFTFQESSIIFINKASKIPQRTPTPFSCPWKWIIIDRTLKLA